MTRGGLWWQNGSRSGIPSGIGSPDLSTHTRLKALETALISIHEAASRSVRTLVL
jgi:hypothetical protein